MNEKLLQKKGVVISQLAAELLEKNVNDRVLPIMQYQKQFHTSQGTIQNAINFLKEKKAIQLVNKGYQGSFIKAIDYNILQDYCKKMNVNGCMPIPKNERMEVLAHVVHQSLTSKSLDLNMQYVQSEEYLWQALITHQCDFIVCSYASAKKNLHKEYEIVMDFGESSLLSKPMLVQSQAPLKTLGIIEQDMVLKSISLEYAKRCGLHMKTISRRNLLTALHQQEIQGFLDEEDKVSDVSNYLTTTVYEEYKEATQAVVVARVDRLDIQTVLQSKLTKEVFWSMFEEYKEAKIELIF